AGVAIRGGAAGIGGIGGSAVESMARQPAAAGQISTAMIITAAMIEGATLFAVVVGMMAGLTRQCDGPGTRAWCRGPRTHDLFKRDPMKKLLIAAVLVLTALPLQAAEEG